MMLVAEFVQRLHPYFKHYRENNGIKPYMQYLICKCFNLSEEDYSEASALRDYKGENEDGEIVKDGPIFRDHIRHFAKKNEKLYDVKSAAGYIEECTRDILNKEQLCQDFADEIPDISVGNYSTKLAEHLGMLLQKAARNETTPSKQSEDADQSSETKDAENNGAADAFVKTKKKKLPTILETDRNMIATIIIELLMRLDELIEWTNSRDAECIHFGYKADQSDLVGSGHEPTLIDRVFGTDHPGLRPVLCPVLPPELITRFGNFTQGNQKLKIFCDRYQCVDQLQNLFTTGNSLKPEHFLPNLSDECTSRYSEELVHYQEMLKQANVTVLEW